jgi:hypothetical protein
MAIPHRTATLTGVAVVEVRPETRRRLHDTSRPLQHAEPTDPRHAGFLLRRPRVRRRESDDAETFYAKPAERREQRLRQLEHEWDDVSGFMSSLLLHEQICGVPGCASWERDKRTWDDWKDYGPSNRPTQRTTQEWPDGLRSTSCPEPGRFTILSPFSRASYARYDTESRRKSCKQKRNLHNGWMTMTALTMIRPFCAAESPQPKGTLSQSCCRV